MVTQPRAHTTVSVHKLGALLCALLMLPILLLPMSATATEPYVPPDLEPWVEWVLHPHQNLACPRNTLSGDPERCAWVSTLDVQVDSRVNFTMQAQVFATSRVELPGNHPNWPTNVQANGSPLTVIGGNAGPSVILEPGNYTITGLINWGKRPTSLQLPAHTGIVNLQIDGNAVLRPSRNGNRLLLGKGDSKTGKTQRNSLSADVFRQIVDNYPLQMVTTVTLTVAGQPRLETLGRVLLNDFEMTAFQSALPARLLPNGDLQVQVEPGEHRVIVRARALNSPSVIAPVATTDNWPTQEIWGFQPQRNLRLTDLSGAAPIDLTQTAAPFRGEDLRGFLLDTTPEAASELRIAVQQRGNPTPPPNRFNVSRDIWLKFDGTGFVVRDNLQATINHASRLSASYSLGRVTVNGQDELINSLSSGADGSEPGIELQAGSYSISAMSEIDRGELVQATGWNLNSDSLRATINMPPGWRLLWTRGVDQAPNAWISRWSLWKIFVLVLLGVLAWRFLGRGFTILLVITAALLMHTAPSIAVAWLLAVGLLSAIRHISHAGALRFLTVIAWGWLGLTTLMAINESVTHARQALYPQLEHYSVMQGNYYEPNDSAIYDMASPESEMRSMADEGIEEVVVSSSRMRKTTQPPPPPQKYSPGLQVQTGPGQPEWRWNQASLIWDGPVSAEQSIKLTWLPPTATRIINALVAALLLAVTALMMLALLTKQARAALPAFAARLAPVVLLALISLPSTEVSAAKPAGVSPELLQQLESRLLEKPACFPNCASLQSADVTANNSTLTITLGLQSAELVAVALPISNAWVPDSVTLNGKPATLATPKPGTLQIVLPKGNHSVLMTGSIAKLERFELNLPLTPAALQTSTSSDWQISGLVNGKIARGSLGFDRKIATTSKDETLKPMPAKPFVTINRTLSFDQEWRMVTEVSRVAPNQGGFSIEVPLLANEAVLNEAIAIIGGSEQTSGKAALVFGRRDQRIEWTSRLEPQTQLTLTAPPSLDRTETWTLQPSNFWHVDYSGLNPVGDSAERSGPTFMPEAGERLNLVLIRTTPVPGATVTISAVEHTTTIGARQQRQTLVMKTLASQGGTLSVQLSAPDNELVQVSINGREEPISLIDNVLPLPITPGNTNYEISWLENTPRATLFAISPATLEHPASNVTTKVEMSRDRWVLFLGGPALGPGILLWGMVLVALILALLIARIPAIPFTALDAILLSLGLSLANLPATLLVAVWVIALRFRGDIIASLTKQWLKNLLQIATAVLSVLTLITLVASVPFALLGSPDMQVQGNGSSAYSYNWFTDQTEGVLPSAWVLSVPMWVYRAMMLIWSLWLAFALIRWVPWAWQQWSTPTAWYSDPNRSPRGGRGEAKRPPKPPTEELQE